MSWATSYFTLTAAPLLSRSQMFGDEEPDVLRDSLASAQLASVMAAEAAGAASAALQRHRRAMLAAGRQGDELDELDQGREAAAPWLPAGSSRCTDAAPTPARLIFPSPISARSLRLGSQVGVGAPRPAAPLTSVRPPQLLDGGRYRRHRAATARRAAQYRPSDAPVSTHGVIRCEAIPARDSRC